MVNNYDDFVRSLFKNMGSENLNLVHAALGIAGESGEVVDLIKKSFAYETPLPREEVIKEVGDLMFYVYALLNTLDLDMNTVLEANIAKLTKRYGGSYSGQKAVDRVDIN